MRRMTLHIGVPFFFFQFFFSLESYPRETFLATLIARSDDLDYRREKWKR